MAESVREIGSCIVTRRDNYAIISFNRPDKFNAFDYKMFESMRDAFYEAADDTSIRAIVFTGSGDHFSAGGDFKKYFEELGELYLGIYSHQVPTRENKKR